jgi:hypothetical protein
MFAVIAVSVGAGSVLGGIAGGAFFGRGRSWADSALVVAAAAGATVAAASVIVGIALGCPDDQPDCDKAYPVGAAVIGALAFLLVLPWATLGRLIGRRLSRRNDVG